MPWLLIQLLLPWPLIQFLLPRLLVRTLARYVCLVGGSGKRGGTGVEAGDADMVLPCRVNAGVVMMLVVAAADAGFAHWL